MLLTTLMSLALQQAALPPVAPEAKAVSPKSRVFELSLGGLSLGSGFLVRYPSGSYLVTAAHVIASLRQRAAQLGEEEPLLFLQASAVGDSPIPVPNARFAVRGNQEVAWVELPGRLSRDASRLCFPVSPEPVPDEAELEVIGHPWSGDSTRAPYSAQARAKPTRVQVESAGYQHYWTTCASKGFSGGPVLDTKGRAVGLHLARRSSKANMWVFLLASAFAEPPTAEEFRGLGELGAIDYKLFYQSVGLDPANLDTGGVDTVVRNRVAFTDLNQWTARGGVQRFLSLFSLASFAMPQAAGQEEIQPKIEAAGARIRTLSLNGKELAVAADGKIELLRLAPGRNVVAANFKSSSAESYNLLNVLEQQSVKLFFHSHSGLDFVVERSVPKAIRRWGFTVIIDLPEREVRAASLSWNPAVLSSRKRDLAMKVPLRSDDPVTGSLFRGTLSLFPLDETELDLSEGFLEVSLSGSLEVAEARLPVFGGLIELEPMSELLVRGRVLVHSALDAVGERIYFRLVDLQLEGAQVEVPLGNLGDQALTFDATPTLTTLMLIWLNNVWLTQWSVPVSKEGAAFLAGLGRATAVRDAKGRLGAGADASEVLERLSAEPYCLRLIDQSQSNCVQVTPASLGRYLSRLEAAEPTDLHDFQRVASEEARLDSLVYWIHVGDLK